VICTPSDRCTPLDRRRQAHQDCQDHEPNKQKSEEQRKAKSERRKAKREEVSTRAANADDDPQCQRNPPWSCHQRPIRTKGKISGAIMGLIGGGGVTRKNWEIKWKKNGEQGRQMRRANLQHCSRRICRWLCRWLEAVDERFRASQHRTSQVKMCQEDGWMDGKESSIDL
jgi:hypothetical protein